MANESAEFQKRNDRQWYTSLALFSLTLFLMYWGVGFEITVLMAMAYALTFLDYLWNQSRHRG